MADKKPHLVAMVSEIGGSMPFIITVCHDGRVDTLDGRGLLPLTKTAKENDAGTRHLAFLILGIGPVSPVALFQNVERKRMGNIVRLHFYERVLEAAGKCLDKWRRCYVLDLHSFRPRPEQDYDIIFGTDNRRTVEGDFDKKFGGLLTEAELRILVQGGPFGATKERTLTRWIKTHEPKVVSIQLEINSKRLASASDRAMLAWKLHAAMKVF